MSIVECFQRFPDDDACRGYIERERWGASPVCPNCGDAHVYRIAGAMGFKCAGCKNRFGVRTGTTMEGSHLPLKKWLLAIYILTTARKGISSVQLAKELSVTQKTAWFLEHRIRAACAGGGSPLSGEVEADESFFGGKAKHMHADKRAQLTGHGGVDKAPVMALVQRGGPVYAFPIPDTSPETAQAAIRKHVAPGSTVYTDDLPACPNLPGYGHQSVRHSAGQYVHGRASTIGVESFWALLKRAYIGTHHWWSVKHLHRYVAEYVYRHNTRPLSGLEAIGAVIRHGEGATLSYAGLIAG